MNAIAEVSHEYYNNDLRGGEGHMEVGKLIMNVVNSKAHMTLSVKPFGCMPSVGRLRRRAVAPSPRSSPAPSSARSRRAATARELLLARADVPLQGEAGGARRVRARAHRERRHARAGEGVPRRRARSSASPFYKAAHVYCGNNADLVAAIAPYITKTRGERWRARISGVREGQQGSRRRRRRTSPSNLFQTAVKEAPVVAARVKEDLTMFRELRAEKKRASAARPSEHTLDAAAEE